PPGGASPDGQTLRVEIPRRHLLRGFLRGAHRRAHRPGTERVCGTARSHRRAHRTGPKVREAQVIKASLLLLVVLLAGRRPRGRAAAERHLLWAAAIALAALLPLLSPALPAWEPAFLRPAADVLPRLVSSATAVESADAGITVRANSIELSSMSP